MQKENEKKDVIHSDGDTYESISMSPLTNTSTNDQFEHVITTIMPKPVSSLTPNAETENDQIKSEPCKETPI